MRGDLARAGRNEQRLDRRLLGCADLDGEAAARLQDAQDLWGQAAIGVQTVGSAVEARYDLESWPPIVNTRPCGRLRMLPASRASIARSNDFL